MPTLEEIGGTWRAGDVLTINNPTVIPAGVTNKTSLYLGVPLGKPITASTAKIEEFTLTATANGSAIFANVDVLANEQYTVIAHTIEKSTGILTIRIQRADNNKTEEFPVRNAVYAYINKLRVVFGDD